MIMFLEKPNLCRWRKRSKLYPQVIKPITTPQTTPSNVTDQKKKPVTPETETITVTEVDTEEKDDVKPEVVTPETETITVTEVDTEEKDDVKPEVVTNNKKKPSDAKEELSLKMNKKHKKYLMLSKCLVRALKIVMVHIKYSQP